MNRPSRRPSSGPLRSDDGVLSLEFALLVPLFFLLVLVLFEFAGVARDALAVQNAAREGARAAATSASEERIRDVVLDALGDRDADVVVSPGYRRPGRLVHVEVSLATRPVRLVTVQLRARATARVEEVVR